MRSSMIKSSLCGLSMLHIHISDTVAELNTTSLGKKWDVSGHPKIALAVDKVKEINEQLKYAELFMGRSVFY